MLRATLLTITFALVGCILAYNEEEVDHHGHPKTVTYFTEASQEYYTRFSRVVYAANMPYFDTDSCKKGKYCITDPAAPLRFDHYKYYWNETYMDLIKVNNLCEYQINTYIDKELADTFFQDGTQPKSLFFACNWSQKCQGLECKFKFPTLIFLMLAPIMFYLGYRWIDCDIRRAMAAAPKREADTIWYSSRTVSIQMPTTNPDEPPSYDSLSDPPSYNTVVKNHVSYTFPSHVPSTK